MSEETNDDFKDLMEIMEKNDPGGKKMQQFCDFMNLVGPHLKKTKEEMIRDIPDGAYNISSGNWHVLTGKMGLINLILKTQEQLK